MSYDAIRSRIDNSDVVILDGAIGTEILRRNLSWADHRLKDEPDAIRDLHADYILAGADVLTTNSFQLARRSCCWRPRWRWRRRLAPAWPRSDPWRSPAPSRRSNGAFVRTSLPPRPRCVESTARSWRCSQTPGLI